MVSLHVRPVTRTCEGFLAFNIATRCLLAHTLDLNRNLESPPTSFSRLIHVQQPKVVTLLDEPIRIQIAPRVSRIWF